MMKKEQHMQTKTIVITGMFAAVIAVLSQIAIPMPSGVPITLQTFAIALTGYVIGWKKGLASTVVYLILGAIGVPIFAGFTGGFQILAGPTGGFMFGFLGMAVLCGFGAKVRNRITSTVLGFAGLFICHLAGAFQFSLVSGSGFVESLMLVSVPYLIKDAISVVLGNVVGIILRKRLTLAQVSVVS